MRLNDFRPQDAETVAAWPSSAGEVRCWAGATAPWPLTASDVRGWHDDPDVHAFVLNDRDAAIAYGEIWVDEAEGEVELARVIVRPDRRGRRVGQLLVSHLVARSLALGARAAFVRVAPGNAAALACYDRAGFTRVSEPEERGFNLGQPLAYMWLRRDLSEEPGPVAD
jgi:ribosomal protein S18 acetylase RimI-like enzyme